jgi:hypothetical protein
MIKHFSIRPSIEVIGKCFGLDRGHIGDTIGDLGFMIRFDVLLLGVDSNWLAKSHVASALHTRSEVLLLGVDSYWLAKSHVVSSLHARLEVSDLGMLSCWLAKSHVVSAVQTRLLLLVLAVDWYSFA